jgi:Reductive dehalogenase subunit
MAIKFGRRLLGRWLTGGERDPLWHHFIYHTPADPNNNLTPALQGAPEGRIYPVKTEATDPQTMSHQIKELGLWLGADLVGVAALQPAHLRSGARSDVPYPFAVVCAIVTDYDPAEAKGLGGQLAVQNGAVVNHHLRNYIRELGYRASIGGTDPVAVAVAAGLGTLERNGRLVTKLHSPYVHVADAILTNLPLAPDAPQP